MLYVVCMHIYVHIRVILEKMNCTMLFRLIALEQKFFHIKFGKDVWRLRNLNFVLSKL